jgi:hypothetical protein
MGIEAELVYTDTPCEVCGAELEKLQAHLMVDGRWMCAGCASAAWVAERGTRSMMLRMLPGDVLAVWVPIGGMGTEEIMEAMQATASAFRSMADPMWRILIMPEGMELEAVPSAQMQAILGERTCAWEPVLSEAPADNDLLRCMTGCGRRIPSHVPFDCHIGWLFCPFCGGRIVATESAHVCATEGSGE